MKKLILIAALTILSGTTALVAGCSNADIAHLGTWGGSQHIVLYAANGSIIGQWDSSGLVKTESGSDGWFFVDKLTGKLVRISGPVVITQN